MPCSSWYTALSWFVRNNAASLRASIRSLLLPSFNRAAFRGLQTTSRLTVSVVHLCDGLSQRGGVLLRVPQSAIVILAKDGAVSDKWLVHVSDSIAPFLRGDSFSHGRQAKTTTCFAC
jgi:hypothetical protein